MIKRYCTITVLILFTLSAFAQKERKVIRQGVKSYQEGDFSEAEVQFRKAQDLNLESFEADFNTGTALYGQEKYEETVKQYEKLVEESTDPETTASIWHNIGNSLLEAQQYEPSIEAYKSSLRNNPGDIDTKYNLAYAKRKLKEQQQQQQDNQDQQDQDQQDNENEDQQEKEDQDQQDKENQDQQEKEDQDQQDKENQDQDQQDQQPKPQEISKEDAERILNAIQQQEKDVKEKVDKKKAAAAKVKTEKDW